MSRQCSHPISLNDAASCHELQSCINAKVPALKNLCKEFACNSKQKLGARQAAHHMAPSGDLLPRISVE